MSKELYLYTGIYDFTAQELIAQIEENMSEEIVLRENSPGGSVFATHGICAKMIEHGRVDIKVDGCAMSSAANLLPYARRVECLDVSKFVLHRADMEVTCKEEQDFLDGINKDLKAKFLLKVDAGKFKEVTGYTINDMFNPSQRINISLTAKQAKAIGLVDEIKKLSPKEITALNEKLHGVAASSEPVTPTEKILIPKKHIDKMDLSTLRAEHPALYNEVIALGKTDAIAQERDRSGAWMKFSDIDPKAVADGIASGAQISQTQMVDFLIKKSSPVALANIEAQAAVSIATPLANDIKAPEAQAADKVTADANLKAFRTEACKMTAQAGVKLSI